MGGGDGRPVARHPGESACEEAGDGKDEEAADERIDEAAAWLASADDTPEATDEGDDRLANMVGGPELVRSLTSSVLVADAPTTDSVMPRGDGGPEPRAEGLTGGTPGSLPSCAERCTAVFRRLLLVVLVVVGSSVLSSLPWLLPVDTRSTASCALDGMMRHRRRGGGIHSPFGALRVCAFEFVRSSFPPLVLLHRAFSLHSLSRLFGRFG